MQYRLKKDLPFAKVGNEVIKKIPQKEGEPQGWYVKFKDKDFNAPAFKWIGYLEQDMSEWIEEVPRITEEQKNKVRKIMMDTFQELLNDFLNGIE